MELVSGKKKKKLRKRASVQSQTKLGQKQCPLENEIPRVSMQAFQLSIDLTLSKHIKSNHIILQYFDSPNIIIKIHWLAKTKFFKSIILTEI